VLVLVTETPIYRGAELFAGQVFCFPESGLREGRTSVRLGFWERQLLSWQVFQNQKMVSHRVRREHGENTEIRPGNANFQVGKSFKTKRWFRTEYAESTERTQRYALGTQTFKLASLSKPKDGFAQSTQRAQREHRENTEIRPGNANFQVGKSFKTKRWFRTEYAESTERTQREHRDTPLERKLSSCQVFQNQKMVSHRVRREHRENTEIRPGNANF